MNFPWIRIILTWLIGIPIFFSIGFLIDCLEIIVHPITILITIAAYFFYTYLMLEFLKRKNL